MPEIKMITETCRSASSTIQSSHDQIQGALSTLNSAIDGLQTAWIATGANTYQADYAQWKANLNTALEALATLKSRLDNEIAEFEATAGAS